MSVARQILFDVIQREGPTIFANAVKRRMHAATALPRKTVEGFSLVSELIRQGRRHGVRKTFTPYFEKAKELPGVVKQQVVGVADEYRALPNWRRKTEFVLTKAVESGTLVAGAYLGFATPNFDAKFFRRKNPLSYVTLHQAPILLVEITIEWMRTVLEKAREHPLAKGESLEEIEGAEKILERLSVGVAAGLSVQKAQRAALGKRFTKKRVVGVSLTDRGYALIEYLFTNLARKKD